MVQGLAPGMQDPEQADLGTQRLRVTRNGLEGLGHRLKQPSRDHMRILQGERTELSREGKDHMAVGHLQHFLLPRRQPGGLGTPLACGAVPIAARVRTDLFMATSVALRCVAAKRGGPALCDGVEHATLRRGRHRAIASQVGVPIVPDDIGDFERWAGHGWPSGGGTSGKVSRGLGMRDSACGVTWR